MNEEERQRKIREIRRTGKTRQWPDTRSHPKWTREHKIAFGWMVLTIAAIVVLIITWG